MSINLEDLATKTTPSKSADKILIKDGDELKWATPAAIIAPIGVPTKDDRLDLTGLPTGSEVKEADTGKVFKLLTSGGESTEEEWLDMSAITPNKSVLQSNASYISDSSLNSLFSADFDADKIYKFKIHVWALPGATSQLKLQVTANASIDYFNAAVRGQIVDGSPCSGTGFGVFQGADISDISLRIADEDVLCELVIEGTFSATASGALAVQAAQFTSNANETLVSRLGYLELTELADVV